MRFLRSALFAALTGMLLPAGPVLAVSIPMAPPQIAAGEDGPATARKLFEEYLEESDYDPRTDLLELEFAEGRLAGVIRVSGRTSSATLLAEFLPKLSGRGWAIENEVARLPDETARGRRSWALVKAPVTHLAAARDAVGNPAASVRTVPVASRVRVLLEEGDAVLGILDDSRIGWLAVKDLSMRTDTGLLAWNRRDKFVVTAPSAKVRNASGQIIMKAPLGAAFTEETDAAPAGLTDSVAVRLPDGQVGVLAKTDVEALGSLESREETRRRETPEKFLSDVAATAEKLVSAGSSRNDYVAPLAVAALGAHDLIAPEDADRLARIEAPLSGGREGEELPRGALVFFGDEKGAVKFSGVWLGKGMFAADDPQTGRAVSMRLADAGKAGFGKFLFGVVPPVSRLMNPCMLSGRSHPFHQAPPAALARCRLR